MKKVLAAILLAIGGMMAGTGALAQVQMDVYFSANAMERETAERLMELTRRAFPQAQWNCRQAEDEESDLRALILADDVPEIVVCAPGEANLWVSDESLLAALIRAFGEEGKRIAKTAAQYAAPFSTEGFAEKVEACYLKAIEAHKRG